MSLQTALPAASWGQGKLLQRPIIWYAPLQLTKIAAHTEYFPCVIMEVACAIMEVACVIMEVACVIMEVACVIMEVPSGGTREDARDDLLRKLHWLPVKYRVDSKSQHLCSR